jgi:hypothetical protein
MIDNFQNHRIGVAALVITALAVTADAQVNERLASYTGRNAEGYLSPLVRAFQANLNTALFHSADIPPHGFHVTLEMTAMGTFFDEESRSFSATTEGDFLPEQTVDAPTVVGNNDAVFVDGVSGTQFAFPGGFDVDHVYYACPQIRVGSFRGTEALGRLMFYDTGVLELGDVSVWGVGLRHDIAQYLQFMNPIDLAVAVTWQNAKLEDGQGNSVIDAGVLSAGLQSGLDLAGMYPYLGLSMSWFDMGVHYKFDEDFGLEPIQMDFEYDASLQLTFGMAYRVGGLAVYGEYSVANQDALAAGLSVTFPFNSGSATP